MTQVVSDLTVSVERSFDVDGDAAFRALVDPAVVGDVERVDAADATRPEGLDAPERPGRESAETGPPPRFRAGETYVGDLPMAFEGRPASFESYFTVEATEYPRLVLSGGGDADAGSFDARVVVAVADVPDGSVVRLDATLDVAGSVAALGPETVRAGLTRAVERYFSDVERSLAHAR